jgi:hypothetical protein
MRNLFNRSVEEREASGSACAALHTRWKEVPLERDRLLRSSRRRVI